MTFLPSLDLEESIARKYKALRADMDERTRRRWAAAEMRELGYGGAAIVHRATGLDPKTIARGDRDLKEQETSPLPAEKSRRIRQKGGGRKTLRSQDSTLLSDLDALIEPTVRGDPMSGIRWTCKSIRILAKELCQKRHKVSRGTVAHELQDQKYSLQGNRKTDEGSSHPDVQSYQHELASNTSRE
jgi:hypothetical protein